DILAIPNNYTAKEQRNSINLLTESFLLLIELKMLDIE
uniref:Uncharacterized protein n=1 Tax=Amphimedon queenslandica TaxID=400682 RepID=A0A1X7UUT3_AMPQE